MADSRRLTARPLCAPAMWVEAPAQLQCLYIQTTSQKGRLRSGRAHSLLQDKVSELFYMELPNTLEAFSTCVGNAGGLGLLPMTASEIVHPS